MSSINKVILMGNLAADPEFKEFANGGKQAKVRLITNERGFTNDAGEHVGERSDSHLVIFKGKSCDTVMKYLKKGNKLFVEGAIRTRNYTDSNNVIKYVTEIYASNFEMMGGKNKEVVELETANTSDDNNGLPF